MAWIDHERDEINVKIVYYGPARSGKTANLHCIYHAVGPELRGQMIFLERELDRALFFDIGPFPLTGTRFQVRFHLYTVPGPVLHDMSCRLVLQGADGIVFVADSRRGHQASNEASFAEMDAIVKTSGADLAEIPLVLQYNKRDLPNILSVEELDASLNASARPRGEAVASRGVGVLEVLEAVIQPIGEELNRRCWIPSAARQVVEHAGGGHACWQGPSPGMEAVEAASPPRAASEHSRMGFPSTLKTLARRLRSWPRRRASPG